MTTAIAMESVAFQDPTFFKELAAVFEELAQVPEKELKKDKEYGFRLNKIIKDHTKMPLVVDLGNIDPCVMIPDLSKNSPLVYNDWKPFFDNGVAYGLLSKSGANYIRGSVNIRSGKVSGIFEEISATIHFPIKMIVGGKYSPQENAGILLHEVGHIFSMYEFVVRMVTTNQILSHVSRLIDGSNTHDERVAVLTTLKKQAELDIDPNKLATAQNGEVISVVVLDEIRKKNRSELGTDIYDRNNWEQLADQYAARMGAGRYLVTGLDKLHRSMFHISFRSTPVYLLMEAIKLILMMLMVTPVGSVFGMIFQTLASMDSLDDGNYDRPEVRLRRIRNQLVESTKERDVTKEELDSIKEDIIAVDLILERVNDRRQFFSVIWGIFSPGQKKRLTAERIQQELESMVSNDLFIRAKDLKLN